MSEVMQVANGPVMWGIALLTIAVVVVQAVLIYRLTKRRVEKEGTLTKEEIRTALKTGGITAIGPAISVFVLALSMISLLGAPATLMRIGIIGSASTEMTVANMGALVAGVTLGAEELTMPAFGAAMLACAFMSCGYLILIPVISRGLGKPLQKIFTSGEDGRPSKLAIFFGTVFPALFFLVLAVNQIAQGLDYLAAMVVSAAIMFVLNKVARDRDIKWLKAWSMGIAVLAAMICGPLFGMIL